MKSPIQRQDEAEAFCAYYGQLEGELLGENLSSYVVDEHYQRILDRHEKVLIAKQSKIVAELRRTFANDIKHFKNALRKVEMVVSDIERDVKKLKSKKEKTE